MKSVLSDHPSPSESGQPGIPSVAEPATTGHWSILSPKPSISESIHSVPSLGNESLTLDHASPSLSRQPYLSALLFPKMLGQESARVPLMLSP